MSAPDARWIISSDQVSSDVQGEAVILSMENGVYYGLDRVGTVVWEQLAEPRTLTELRDTVVARFEVEPERAESDILTLMADLEANGLVERRES